MDTSLSRQMLKIEKMYYELQSLKEIIKSYREKETKKECDLSKIQGCFINFSDVKFMLLHNNKVFEMNCSKFEVFKDYSEAKEQQGQLVKLFYVIS